MRILGIDPGSITTGWAVISGTMMRPQYVASGALKLKATSASSMTDRLALLHEELTAIISEYKPDTAAIESVFMKINPKTALVLGQARGVCLAALGSAALQPVEYSPTKIKKALVRSGRADKQQIMRMVRGLLNYEELDQEDEADALAIALCHMQHLPLAQMIAQQQVAQQ